MKRIIRAALRGTLKLSVVGFVVGTMVMSSSLNSWAQTGVRLATPEQSNNTQTSYELGFNPFSLITPGEIGLGGPQKGGTEQPKILPLLCAIAFIAVVGGGCGCRSTPHSISNVFGTYTNRMIDPWEEPPAPAPQGRPKHHVWEPIVFPTNICFVEMFSTNTMATIPATDWAGNTVSCATVYITPPMQQVATVGGKAATYTLLSSSDMVTWTPFQGNQVAIVYEGKSTSGVASKIVVNALQSHDGSRLVRFATNWYLGIGNDRWYQYDSVSTGILRNPDSTNQQEATYWKAVVR